jgi:hypothetical protein
MKFQTIALSCSLIALCLSGCDAVGVANNQKPIKSSISQSKIKTPLKNWWLLPLKKAMASNGEIEVRDTVTSAYGFVCGMARPTKGRKSFLRFIVRDTDDVILETDMPWEKFRETLITDCAMEE